MGTIIFSMLSAGSCVFLMYVLVRFHGELRELQKRSAGDPRPIFLGSFAAEPPVSEVKSRPYAGGRQPAKIEAVMRREILISGILGLFGLLAPFIFVVLLGSSNTWHH
jgi:hypothetical protein